MSSFLLLICSYMYTVWHYLSPSLNLMQKNPKRYILVSCVIAAKHFLVPMVSSGDVISLIKRKKILPSLYEILEMPRHIVRMHFMTTLVVFLVVRFCSGELWQNENIFEIFQFSTRVNILCYTGRVLMFSWWVKY